MDYITQILTNGSHSSYILLLFLLNIIFLFWYHRYLKIGRNKAALLWLVSSIGGAVIIVYHAMGQKEQFQGQELKAIIPSFLILFFRDFFIMLVVPFVTKLYLKWVCSRTTAEEKAPNMMGVRAWLSTSNCASAILISIFGWLGFGYSVFGIFILTMLALLAYPIVNTASQNPHPEEIQKEDLTVEREKILKMLEDGKITAEESAELLNALGQTIRPTISQTNITTPPRKMALIGSALVLLGFFLPWFNINPGQELSRMAGDAVSFNMHTGSINVAGGDIQHGLGWFILFLAMGVAILPYVATTLDRQTQWTFTALGLGIGTIILVYLFTQNLRYVNIGIILVLAGYILEFIGVIKEHRTVAIR